MIDVEVATSPEKRAASHVGCLRGVVGVNRAALVILMRGEDMDGIHVQQARPPYTHVSHFQSKMVSYLIEISMTTRDSFETCEINSS